MKEVIVTDREMTAEQVKEASDQLQHLATASMHPSQRMRKLYEFADKQMHGAFGDVLVCKRGCSHCCSVNVHITAYEATYIAANAELDIPDYSPNKKGDYTNLPCPFLKDHLCSIYEYRPMACRAFGTLDSADYCADDSFPSHMVIELRPPGGGGVDAVNWAYHIIMQINDRDPAKDIREFFGTDPVEVVK